MTTIYTEPEQTEKKKYKAEVMGTALEIAEVGGIKTLCLSNILFQSDADALAKANALLTRLKSRKEYVEGTIEYCAVPVERRDTIILEERLTPTKNINHIGIIRKIEISVSPANQTLTLTIEE